jgi:hypothetical protein
MSFSTKSSRDTLSRLMSLQTIVTFKTISFFGTHDGERNARSSRLDARNSMTVRLHAYCCPPLKQVDRSLCTTGDVQRESHPQLAWSASGSVKGTWSDYTRRLLRRCIRSMVHPSLSTTMPICSSERRRFAWRTSVAIKRIRSPCSVTTCAARDARARARRVPSHPASRP